MTDIRENKFHKKLLDMGRSEENADKITSYFSDPAKSFFIELCYKYTEEEKPLNEAVKDVLNRYSNASMSVRTGERILSAVAGGGLGQRKRLDDVCKLWDEDDRFSKSKFKWYQKLSQDIKKLSQDINFLGSALFFSIATSIYLLGSNYKCYLFLQNCSNNLLFSIIFWSIIVASFLFYKIKKK